MPMESPGGKPQLPPRLTTDRLLFQYKESIHTLSPIVDWQSFVQQYRECFEEGSFNGQRRVFIALFFAVLAIGSLQTPPNDHTSQTSGEGPAFFNLATRYVSVESGHLTLDHCRTAFMLSMYCAELNLRPMCRTWLATALTYAVEIGLHYNSDSSSVLDAEAGRLIWFSLYSYDRYDQCQTCLRIQLTRIRLLSLELSRPTQISEEDCNVRLSHPLLEAVVRHPAQTMQPTDMSQPHPAEIMAAISRLVARLKKVFRSPMIDIDTLQALESHLDALAQTFPDPLHPNSSTYIDPRFLWILTIVSNTKIMLHRHIISPNCSRSDRGTALGRCAAAARLTARTISRSLQRPPSSAQPYTDPSRSTLSWEDRVLSFTPSHLCTHLWRCILILSFLLDFTGASICARLSSTIGTLRPVNTSCGRYIVFFLEKLRERLSSGDSEQYELENDEEMLAYVSADLQADPMRAWIWGPGEGPPQQYSSTPTSPWAHQQASMQYSGTSQSPVWHPSEAQSPPDDWGGWQRVFTLLTELHDLNQRRREQHQSHEPQQYQRLPLLRPLQTTQYPAPPGIYSTSSQTATAGFDFRPPPPTLPVTAPSTIPTTVATPTTNVSMRPTPAPAIGGGGVGAPSGSGYASSDVGVAASSRPSVSPPERISIASIVQRESVGPEEEGGAERWKGKGRAEDG